MFGMPISLCIFGAVEFEVGFLREGAIRPWPLTTSAAESGM